jgi:hypothetical protein
MVDIGPGNKGMVLKEIHLGPLLEILWQALGEEVHAEVIIDEVLIVVVTTSSSVKILMVTMGDNDAIGCTLVNLRSHNGIFWVGIESTEALASKVPLHRICIVVHENSILCLEHWLNF